MTFREAIRKALADEMTLDENVILLGEDIGIYGGCFKVTEGLYRQFPNQVLDTPVSEEAFSGMATGAAMMGLRPVVEIMYADFFTLISDSVINHAAKAHFLSNGRFCCPMVIRFPEGSGTGHGAQHTQSPQAFFMNVPGLKIVSPSCPDDAYHLLRASVRDNNPVLFFEHKLLYSDEGEISDIPCEIGKAKVLREGSDITLISYSHAMKATLEAAEKLEENNISASVIDLRTLKPLDEQTILTEVSKTGRAVIVTDTDAFASVASAVSAVICSDEETFKSLKAPVKICGGISSPVPFAKDLEALSVPCSDYICKKVFEIIK